MRYEQCVLGTCCLPWKPDFTLDDEVFIRQIHRLNSDGTQHLYIFGTAGEGYAVSDGQFKDIARLFTTTMREVGGRPMVGVISLSLTTIIERIEFCMEIGVDEIQVSLPAWGACTWPEIKTFFAETCGRFPKCRFLHYNVARAKRQLTPLEHGSLAGEYENLVATKSGNDSAGHLRGLFTEAPSLRHFLTESAFASAALMGYEPGLLISLSSIHWRKAMEFYNACLAGDTGSISRFSSELKAIRKGLGEAVGTAGHMDGVFDKLYCKLADTRFPLRLLSPYLSSGEDAYNEFREFLTDRFPEWLVETD